MDRMEEFKDVPWQQGRLLITHDTKRWSKETQAGADLLEQCCAFAHFTAEDEGRGRKFVARHANPVECAAAVKAHNDALLKVPNVELTGAARLYRAASSDQRERG